MAQDGGMSSLSTAAPRRTTSIFSRRGSSKLIRRFLPTIDEAVQSSTKTSHSLSNPLPPLRKRNESIRSASKPKRALSKQRGTILNAVPPAKSAPRLTALEFEMATSPNREILSAISGRVSPLSETQSCTPLIVARPSSQDIAGTNLSTSRFKTRPKRSKGPRIGVWHDGSFSWDDEAIQKHRESCSGCPKTESAVDSRIEAQAAQPTRLTLTVPIPQSESLAQDNTIAALLSPLSHDSPSASHSTSEQPMRSQVSNLRANNGRARDIVPLSELMVSFRHESISVGNLDGRSDDESSCCPSSSTNASLCGERSHLGSRNSDTSIDDNEAEPSGETAGRVKARSSLEILSAVSPLGEGAFDHKFELAMNMHKPLPPVPSRSFARKLVQLPRLSTPSLTERGAAPSRRGGTVQDREFGMPLTRERPPTQSPFLQPLLRASNANGSSVVEMRPATPTMGQALKDLSVELSRIAQDKLDTSMATEGSQLLHENLIEDIQPLPCTPALPKKSRRRDWDPRTSKLSSAGMRLSLPPRRFSDGIAVTAPHTGGLQSRSPRHVLYRSSSSNTDPEMPGFAGVAHVASTSRRRGFDRRNHIHGHPIIEDGLVVTNGPNVLRNKQTPNPTGIEGAAVAKAILFKIMAALPTLKDLVHASMANRGMYLVYQQREAELVRAVAWNESPAALEFMQWSDLQDTAIDSATSNRPGSSQTARLGTYLRSYHTGTLVIEALKRLVLERCVSLIRKETASALLDRRDQKCQRFSDAFWRICSFCKIFGGDDCRENDIAAQLDWLRGGSRPGPHYYGSAFTTSHHVERAHSPMKPPAFFATGNNGGLSSEDVYDMLELWKCFKYLLKDYLGHVKEAKRVGVFESFFPTEGDEQLENLIVREWTLYLLTLGPSIVLDLAEIATDSVSDGLEYAKAYGWTNWRPPAYARSRKYFLKDPLSRLYQEWISVKAPRAREIGQREEQYFRHQHVAGRGADIYSADQSNPGRQSLPMETNTRYARSSAPHGHHYMTFSQLTHRLIDASNPPVSNQSASRSLMDSPVASRWDCSHLRYFHGVAENTSELAVRTIVDMGFTPAEARNALRVTDLGTGLRVDRAVELLMLVQEN